jgi:hypothetical protein
MAELGEIAGDVGHKLNPAALKKKLGPFPVWVWGLLLGGAVAIGIVIYRNKTAASTAAAAATPAATGAATDPTAQATQDAATTAAYQQGLADGSVGATPVPPVPINTPVPVTTPKPVTGGVSLKTVFTGKSSAIVHLAPKISVLPHKVAPIKPSPKLSTQGAIIGQAAPSAVTAHYGPTVGNQVNILGVLGAAAVATNPGLQVVNGLATSWTDSVTAVAKWEIGTAKGIGAALGHAATHKPVPIKPVDTRNSTAANTAVHKAQTVQKAAAVHQQKYSVKASSAGGAAARNKAI